MKLRITQSDEYHETEIDIRCQTIDSRLQKIIDIASGAINTITLKADNAVRIVRLSEICYIESVDEKTFVYLKDAVYRSDQKLYALEEQLAAADFVRVSKSCLLNIDYLDSVRALLNGKLEATLSNGEKVIINRHYVPAFKAKFGL